jgi:hypothetical protein
MMKKRSPKRRWFPRTAYGRASTAGHWRSNQELFDLLKGVFGLEAFLTFPELPPEAQKSFFAQVDTLERSFLDAARTTPIERRMLRYNNLAHNEVEASTHAPASLKRWKRDDA